MNKKSGKKQLELLLLCIITVYFAVLAYYTPQYGSKARLFPIIVLSLGALLLLLKFLAVLSPKCASFFEPKEQPKIDISQFEGKADVLQDEQETPMQKGSVLWVLLWLVLSVALIYCLGLLLGIFVATGTFFLFIARMKWYKALLGTAALTLAIHLIFAVALNMRLYSGLWL